MVSVEYQNKINEVIDKLENLEKYYNDCASKALDKGHIQGAQIHAAQASSFVQAVWIVEDIMCGDENLLENSQCGEDGLNE